MRTGGAEILVIDEAGKEHLVPLAADIVVEIYPAAKKFWSIHRKGYWSCRSLTRQQMLRFDIITIFPEFFREAIDCGIVRRARNAGLVEIIAHDLRQWTTDKHHVVDDRPFGGGDGMVLKPEPIFAGVEALTGARETEIFQPERAWCCCRRRAKVFTQALAQDLSQKRSRSCFCVAVTKESTKESPKRWSPMRYRSEITCCRVVNRRRW